MYATTESNSGLFSNRNQTDVFHDDKGCRIKPDEKMEECGERDVWGGGWERRRRCGTIESTSLPGRTTPNGASLLPFLPSTMSTSSKKLKTLTLSRMVIGGTKESLDWVYTRVHVRLPAGRRRQRCFLSTWWTKHIAHAPGWDRFI